MTENLSHAEAAILSGHYGKVYLNIDPDDLFRAAGVQKDEEKLRYYILLDELN